MGLEPVSLKNEASGGRTIVEKIEHYTDVSYAIVLYTSCDESRRHGERAWRPRARQNVVYEHGYLGCKLGCGHVVALVDENVELPSDCSGVVYISRRNAQWKSELAREMKEAGLRFDSTRITD